jgi:hypothetical protein
MKRFMRNEFLYYYLQKVDSFNDWLIVIVIVLKLESNLSASTSQNFISLKNYSYSYLIECHKCYSDIHLYKSSDITNIFHERHQRISLINSIFSARVFNNYFCDIIEFWIIEFKIFAFNLIECVGEKFIVIFSVKIIKFLIFNIIFKFFLLLLLIWFEVFIIKNYFQCINLIICITDLQFFLQESAHLFRGKHLL